MVEAQRFFKQQVIVLWTLLLAMAVTWGCQRGTAPSTANEPQRQDSPAAAAGANQTTAMPAMLMPARAGEWLEPDQRDQYDFDHPFTDQDGREVNLTSWVGKPLAMSFIFTRCPNPNMCPLITARMAQLEVMLDKAGLGGKVNLLLLTYDPAWDTPERLKAYGESQGMQFTHSAILRPNPDTYPELIHALGIDAKFAPNGMVTHFIDLYLFDRRARRARYYTAAVWNNKLVLEDLKKLVAETDEAQPQ